MFYRVRFWGLSHPRYTDAPRIIFRENLSPALGILLCLALHKGVVWHMYQGPIVKMFLFLHRSVPIVRHPMKGHRLAFNWCCGMPVPLVLENVFGALPPGIQPGCWKAVKSRLGSFHLGFEVKLFHYTEMCYKWIYETISQHRC